MKKLYLLIIFCFVLVANIFSQEKKFDKVVLLQLDEYFYERCPDVEELTGYLKELQTEIEKTNNIGDGYIVIALRPGAKSNIWFDVTGNKNLKSLKKKLLSITPCHVQGGVVLIALSNLDDPLEKLPLPEEWNNYLSEHSEFESLEISELVDKIWPPEITAKEKNKLLKLINKFKNEKDFSQESLQKYSDIITYASESEIITIQIDSECFPIEIADNEYGSIFLLAYICGNMEKQLLTENYENSKEDGIQFELMKYEQIKKTDKEIKINFFENLLQKGE